MTFLAPPPTDDSDTIAVAAGHAVVANSGCGDCHTDPSVTSGALATAANFRAPGTTTEASTRNFTFHPYSDFSMHDMASLGDRIGDNAGDAFNALSATEQQNLTEVVRSL